MKSRLNLKKKAIFLVVGILFIALCLNTAVLTFISYNNYKNAIFGKTKVIGENFQKEIYKVLTLGVAIETFEGVNEKLQELASKEATIKYAMIMDATGKVLFHSDESKIGRQLEDKITSKSSTSGEILVQSPVYFYIDISFPLLNAFGKIVGTLRVGIQLKEMLYELLLWAFGISVLCFVTSLGLVYFLMSRFIIEPIMTMEQAADKIAAGDLTYEVSGIKGTDELGSLGNAIKRMAFNLKDILSRLRNITNSVSNVTSNIAESSQSILQVSDIQKKAVDETASAVEEMDRSILDVSTRTVNLSESAADTSTAISQMKASIETVAENANIFSQTANDAASSIEEMIATVKQISDSLGNLSLSSVDIVSSIDKVNTTTMDIEHRANESVTLAEAVMINASEKGIKVSGAAMEGMEAIKKSVLTVSEVLNMLGKKTNDIGKILNVINSVADQTNLLALNAAILASKAGEHGRGFSVVSDEIKDLAERTSLSTSEIEDLIKSVQEETRSTIKLVSDAIQAVENGITLVKDVNDALRDIVESSNASTEMAKAIQKSTADEAVIIKQISSSIESMNLQIEKIARALQEQDKGGSFIIDITEKIKELSYQVKIAVDEQKEVSLKIAEIIENVSQESSQIANSTNKHKDRSVEIVQSMDKIRSATINLTTSSNEMNKVISSLKEEALHLISEMHKFKV